MNEFENLDKTKLSAAERKAVERFCWEAREGLGEKLLSITLYGSAARNDYHPGRSDINILVLTSTLSFPAMQTLLDPVSRGLRVGIHPLLMTDGDLHSSTDIFPVKFLSMKESHYTLWGEDPLSGLVIEREHLRLRCEQEIMNLLLRLRRYYIYHGGWNLEEKISGSVTGFLENLRVALSLGQEAILTRDQTYEAAEKHGISSSTLARVVAVKNQSPPREELETIYSEYLVAVERAAKIVDSGEV